MACGLDIVFIPWKEIYLLLKIPGTVGTRGEQREELRLEMVGVCVRLLRCECVYVCVYISLSLSLYVHTHPPIYTRGMFLFADGVASWPHESFRGYVSREAIYESKHLGDTAIK